MNRRSPKPRIARFCHLALPWCGVAFGLMWLVLVSSCASNDDARSPVQLGTLALIDNGSISMSPAFEDHDIEHAFLVQSEGDVNWHHTVGIQDITYAAGESLRRQVEVWVTPDGRYRAKTTSLDGSETAEEVAYDGHGHQLIVFTDPFGRQKALVIENSTHFAVTGFTNGTNRKLGDTMIVEASMQGAGGSVTYEAGPIELGSGNVSTLNVVLPDGIDVHSMEDFMSSSQDSQSVTVAYLTGSSSAIMYNIVGEPCLAAYNRRNSETDFFTGSSHIRGICTLVAVSIWSNSANAHSCGWAWIAHAYLPTYVSWSGYFEVDADDYACSAHAGWDDDLTMHVGYNGLRAAVTG